LQQQKIEFAETAYRYKNAWFCKQCNCLTEHKKMKNDQEVCLICGFRMGKPVKEKLTAQQRNYYLKNKEKIRNYQRNCRLKNKEKLTAQKRNYRLKNKEKLTAQQRNYYLKNKEKIRNYQRDWRKCPRIEKKIKAVKMEASP